MFTNPTIFTCPFCPEPEGEIFVSANACLDQRIEDPDPVYLHDGALDEEQDMVRFGYGTDRRVPCRHLVFARGGIAYYGRGEEEDWDGSAVGPEWGIEFDWVPPTFRTLARGLGALVMGSPEQLAEVGAAHKPRVRVAFDRPSFSWDALVDSRTMASIYRVEAVFVAASRPLALRAAIEARVAAIRAYGKKLKGGG